MAVVPVTGTLTDAAGVTLTSQSPVLKFYLSQGAYAPNLVATRPVEVPVGAGGAFTAQLHESDELAPAGFYTVVAEWLAPGGEVHRSTVWEKLFVPLGGGDISTFPNVPRTAADWWVGLEDNPPPAGFRGWWLVSDPSVTPEDEEAAIGDVRRVY